VSWFKITDAKTGRVIQDSRHEHLSYETLDFITQFSAVGEKHPDVAEKIAIMVESTVVEACQNVPWEGFGKQIDKVLGVLNEPESP
jgi:hypothetical protein